MIINLIIIVFILMGLTIHRYLSYFWEQQKLPYPAGFVVFATIFALIYLVSFSWMFGIIAGIIISILCYFQIIYSAGLWILLLPSLLRMNKPNRSLSRSEVSPYVYGGFSYLVAILGILTIVNFFVSEYQSMLETFKISLWIVILSGIGIIAIGNVVRMIVMSRITKVFEKSY